MPISPVQDFLYNTFGYGRIDDLMSGLKPEGVQRREFLEGTILGTFGRRASTSSDTGSYSNPSPTWKRSSIRIPHIFNQSQLEEQISAGKDYLNQLQGQNILRPEILKRQFFLSSYTSFVGLTSNGVKERLSKIHTEDFPNAQYNWKRIGRFQCSITQDDFYLFSEGASTKYGAKLICIAFNLPQSEVENLNNIAKRFNFVTRDSKSS